MKIKKEMEGWKDSITNVSASKSSREETTSSSSEGSVELGAKKCAWLVTNDWWFEYFYCQVEEATSSSSEFEKRLKTSVKLEPRKRACGERVGGPNITK